MLDTKNLTNCEILPIAYSIIYLFSADYLVCLSYGRKHRQSIRTDRAQHYQSFIWSDPCRDCRREHDNLPQTTASNSRQLTLYLQYETLFGLLLLSYKHLLTTTPVSDVPPTRYILNPDIINIIATLNPADPLQLPSLHLHLQPV